MNDIRRQTVLGLKAGQEFAIERRFSAEEVAAFAAISRDDNPIHSDPDFISSKGMKGPICHGLLVASMLTEIGGQIGWLASEMNMKFLRPVYINETIRCIFAMESISSTNRAVAKIVFKNSENETVLKATLKGILPSKSEREILECLTGSAFNK